MEEQPYLFPQIPRHLPHQDDRIPIALVALLFHDPCARELIQGVQGLYHIQQVLRAQWPIFVAHGKQAYSSGVYHPLIPFAVLPLAL